MKAQEKHKKNILLTGINSGLGQALLHYFWEHPQVDKIFGWVRDEKKLSAELLEKRGDRLQFLIADLENRDAIEKTISQLPSDFALDILINNAGIVEKKPFEEIDFLTQKRLFDVNFFASALLIQKLLPYLKKSPSAHVLNIVSMGSFQGSVKFEGLSFYASSKAALSNLTEVLAQEYAATHVRFNALALGAVQTPMLERVFPAYKTEMSAEKMAEFIGFFALEGHHFLNGKILPISNSTP